MFNEFMKMVDACGTDAIIEREFENDEAVDALLAWLNANCTERDANLYVRYTFPDFQLTVGYASFNI